MPCTIYAQTGPLSVVDGNRSLLIINSLVVASASITGSDMSMDLALGCPFPTLCLTFRGVGDVAYNRGC